MPEYIPKHIYGERLALARLRTKLENERSTCWLVVVLAGLACMAGGFFIGRAIAAFMLFPYGISDFASIGPLDIFQHGAIGRFGLALPVITATVVSFVPPVALGLLIGFGSWKSYKRTYDYCLHGLIYGDSALALMEDHYVHHIEESIRHKFRLGVRPISPGKDFLGRINYFAHYYDTYEKLSSDRKEPRISAAPELSCWMDGLTLAISSCFVACVVGIPVLAVVAIRVVQTWPRLVAVKTAVLEFLEGKHDDKFPPAPLPKVN